MANRCNPRFNFCTFFWIFYFSILILILFFFIFWLIFLPKELKFTVTDGTLTRFDFNPTNNTLGYNLTLNITVRNPNKRVGVYFKRIQMHGFYGKKRFGMVSLTPFYQGHKNTSVLQVAMQGDEEVVVFGRKENEKYENDKGIGVYGIDIDLKFKIKARYGKIKIGSYKPPTVNCDLKVGLRNDGKLGSSFKATKCGNAQFFSDPGSDF